MKPDLNMYFSNFQGLGSVGRIALEGGTEIKSETASRTQYLEPSRRGMSSKWLLQAGLVVKL